jgi:methionine-rich copper-binding protein CopC
MHRMSARARARIAGVAAVLALVLALGAPGAVLGHAALESADPAPDSAIPETPELVTADFTERLDPNLSSLTLAAPDGTILATGGVAAEDPEARQMALRPPALAPGRYTVQWTAVTPDDGAVEQGTYAFTIALPTPTPAPSVTGAPTPAPTPTPTLAASASASATVSPAASASPSASAVASPGTSASPAASPEPGSGGSGNGLSPIVVAIVAALVAAVAVAAVYTWRRRGSGGT